MWVYNSTVDRIYEALWIVKKNRSSGKDLSSTPSNQQ